MMPDIMDRRNELAGNLSLYQEIYFIEKINEWVAEGVLSNTKHEVIEVKWIEMLRALDSESKLDRDPQFIQSMVAYGEDRAGAFLANELAGVGGVGGRTG
jgi:NTE family protein